MNSSLKIILATFLVLVLVYLSLPGPGFPEPPPGSRQSQEPADLETPLRRGYYTDATRQEVMEHYKKQFSKTLLGLPLLTLRLNYPPEDAKVLIREQTESTFLEELVHPMRESLFVNGFEPKEESKKIVVDGKRYSQKVIVRHIPTSFVFRVPIIFSSLALLFFVLREWGSILRRRNA